MGTTLAGVSTVLPTLNTSMATLGTITNLAGQVIGVSSNTSQKLTAVTGATSTAPIIALQVGM